jgi:hypothetical protein
MLAAPDKTLAAVQLADSLPRAVAAVQVVDQAVPVVRADVHPEPEDAREPVEQEHQQAELRREEGPRDD